MSRTQDLLAVIKGLQAVSKAGFQLQEENFRLFWNNSFLRTAAENLTENLRKGPKDILKNVGDFNEVFKEGTERLSTVVESAKEYLSLHNNEKVPNYFSSQTKPKPEHDFTKSEVEKDNQFASSQSKQPLRNKSFVRPTSAAEEYKVVLTPSDKELLKRLDREHREKLAKEREKEQVNLQKKLTESASMPKERIDDKTGTPKEESPKVQAVPNPKSKQTLSASAKQRTVPSSRIGRMLSFGSLAAGLGIGTAAEFTKRTLGISENSDGSTLFLTESNMNRIVDTLCKVRGAALKIGQMLSIQDESIISPQLAKALERVRQSADFMPNWQIEQVLKTELGDNWRSKLSKFEEKPFAAASIGQVHWAETLDGTEVAMKIQYPGVAKSIESDIDNLVGIMKVWNIFPKGMFIDNVVTVAKRELAWEVDYLREAECTRKFAQLLKNHESFYVPRVINELSCKQVITTELVEGIPVDKCVELSDEHRRYVAMKIMELCLLELMEFRYMQTDPNWANFFYNPDSKKILLLDFGASREYSKKFVDTYVRIIKAAADNDRNRVLKLSQKLGFLTGYESQIMEDAHIDAVMILGEVFRVDGEYNFSARETTLRIQNLVPTMLAHRLCPPPEEIYSLHRKLSGVYLLCSKLNVAFPARQLFLDMYSKYRFDDAEDSEEKPNINSLEKTAMKA